MNLSTATEDDEDFFESLKTYLTEMSAVDANDMVRVDALLNCLSHEEIIARVRALKTELISLAELENIILDALSEDIPPEAAVPEEGQQVASLKRSATNPRLGITKSPTSKPMQRPTSQQGASTRVEQPIRSQALPNFVSPPPLPNSLRVTQQSGASLLGTPSAALTIQRRNRQSMGMTSSLQQSTLTEYIDKINSLTAQNSTLEKALAATQRDLQQQTLQVEQLRRKLQEGAFGDRLRSPTAMGTLSAQASRELAENISDGVAKTVIKEVQELSMASLRFHEQSFSTIRESVDSVFGACSTGNRDTTESLRGLADKLASTKTSLLSVLEQDVRSGTIDVQSKLDAGVAEITAAQKRTLSALDDMRQGLAKDLEEKTVIALGTFVSTTLQESIAGSLESTVRAHLSERLSEAVSQSIGSQLNEKLAESVSALVASELSSNLLARLSATMAADVAAEVDKRLCADQLSSGGNADGLLSRIRCVVQEVLDGNASTVADSVASTITGVQPKIVENMRELVEQSAERILSCERDHASSLRSEMAEMLTLLKGIEETTENMRANASDSNMHGIMDTLASIAAGISRVQSSTQALTSGNLREDIAADVSKAIDESSHSIAASVSKTVTTAATEALNGLLGDYYDQIVARMDNSHKESSARFDAVLENLNWVRDNTIERINTEMLKHGTLLLEQKAASDTILGLLAEHSVHQTAEIHSAEPAPQPASARRESVRASLNTSDILGNQPTHNAGGDPLNTSQLSMVFKDYNKTVSRRHSMCSEHSERGAANLSMTREERSSNDATINAILRRMTELAGSITLVAEQSSVMTEKLDVIGMGIADDSKRSQANDECLMKQADDIGENIAVLMEGEHDRVVNHLHGVINMDFWISSVILVVVLCMGWVTLSPVLKISK